MIAWEEFDEISEGKGYGDDFYEAENVEDDNDGHHEEESQNVIPWHIAAINSLIELKDEVEDDLTCDVDNTRATQNKISSAKCDEKLAAAAVITNDMLHGKGRCTVEVWRCFSTVLEGMVKYVENLTGMFG